MNNDSLSKPKQTARKTTRYVGVQSRESKIRKSRGKADICFTIDYIDALTKKRIRKDIGWTSDGITAAYASQVRAELMKQSQINTEKGDYLPAQSINLGAGFTKYVDEWLIPRGKRHKGDASMFHTNLALWLHLKLEDITPYVIDNMVKGMSEKGLSAHSIRYVIGIIKRVMHKMEAWGLYHGQMPFKKVTLPKVNNTRQRFLIPNEAAHLLTHLRTRSHMVYMQSLISLLCGLRFGEIAALTLSDVDFFSSTITIRDAKSGKSRQAVMTEHLKLELRAYLAVHPQIAELLFPANNGAVQGSISKTFARTVVELGFNRSGGVEISDARQRLVFHSLRHTYASWLAMSGQGQAMIADLLGHSSLEMSRRYTHLLPGARRDTAKAIDSMFHSTTKHE